MSRDLPRAPFRTPDVPSNGVIPTRNPPFGLPFDITRIVRGGTGDGGRIAEFEHHLAKEDTSGEHVGHLRGEQSESERQPRIKQSHGQLGYYHACLLTVKVYSPSSGLSNNLTRFSPSMIVATELPKNLDCDDNHRHTRSELARYRG